MEYSPDAGDAVRAPATASAATVRERKWPIDFRPGFVLIVVLPGNLE
jgi:hypothetical protein